MDAFFIMGLFIVKPTIDSVKSIFVCLQADNSLRTDVRIMNGASWQVESVTGFERKLLSKFRQAKCDISLYNIDNLVVGMRVRRINVKGTV